MAGINRNQWPECVGIRKVIAKGRQQQVNARSLFCFWEVRELGIPLNELARRLEMSPPTVGYAVQRGEAIAQQNRWQLDH